MEQPKFKFGEKVLAPNGHVFIVCDIRRDAEHSYIYNGDRESGPHYGESELRLYENDHQGNVNEYSVLSLSRAELQKKLKAGYILALIEAQDPLLKEAFQLMNSSITGDIPSASMLQRHLKCGFQRACDLRAELAIYAKQL